MVLNNSLKYVHISSSFEADLRTCKTIETHLVPAFDLAPSHERHAVSCPPLNAHHIYVAGHLFDTHGEYYLPSKSYIRRMASATCAVIVGRRTTIINLDAPINLVNKSVHIALRLLIILTPSSTTVIDHGRMASPWCAGDDKPQWPEEITAGALADPRAYTRSVINLIGPT